VELDLETFLTTLYVKVDDLYQSHVRPGYCQMLWIGMDSVAILARNG
jgi:hypothetical protein